MFTSRKTCVRSCICAIQLLIELWQDNLMEFSTFGRDPNDCKVGHMKLAQNYTANMCIGNNGFPEMY